MERIGFFLRLLIHELRLLPGLALLAGRMGFTPGRRGWGLAALGGGLVAVLEVAGLPDTGGIAVEMAILAALAGSLLRESERLRRCLFLLFFYELGVALWDFLLPAWLGVLSGQAAFAEAGSLWHLLGVCVVRLLLVGLTAALGRTGGKAAVEALGSGPAGDDKAAGNSEDSGARRLVTVVAILGFFGAVTLSEQSRLPLSEDQTGTWVILAMVLLFAVLVYRLSRQREMEAELARLRQEQAESQEREYQALRQTYAGNARLYHDLHNYLETLYQCLRQGDTEEALRYCRELRDSTREISQSVWTGDKALDCLISSKMAQAEQQQIRTEVNVEFPRNTNLRSVDLTAILGNLLDNALEAAEKAPEERRFLRLTIRRIWDMVVIKVENGCGQPPVRKEGELRTTKEDKAAHGWGLQSVRTAAQRYDGAVDTVYENGVFRAVVTLSFSPVR